MKKIILGVGILLISCLALQESALARSFLGKVSAVDSKKNTLALGELMPGETAIEDIHFSLDQETTYKGVESASQLELGSVIIINAKADEDGNWVAIEITANQAAS